MTIILVMDRDMSYSAFYNIFAAMIVHGEGERLVPAHLNFGKFMLDRLRKANPDDTCLVNCTTGDQLTYGEFVQHAVSVSAALAQLGVARGDTVAVAGEPRAAFTPTALAVVLAGAAYTPFDLNCGRAVLAHKFNLTRPKYVICSRLFWEAYSDILRGLDFIKTFICFDAIDDIPLSVAAMASRHVDAATFEPAAVNGQTDVAMIVYSSGTTGASKGVMMTHLNCITRTNLTWLYTAENLQNAFLFGELSSTFNNILIFHFLSTGKRVIYTENGVSLKTLQDYQVNIMIIVPVVVENMANVENVGEFDLSSLKVVHCGGDQLHDKIKTLFKLRYPNVKLLQIYGMTESGVFAAQTSPKSEPTVGVPVVGVTLKVVDINTRLTLGPNQRGEVCVRGPFLMKGYLGATSPYLDDQGFFLTGDLGYYDDHKQFYLLSRLKDVISFNSNKIAPGEIEAVLLAHPAVLEAAVVGKPAGAVGELPTAFVVLRPDAKVTETELVDYVDKEVSDYMRLRGGVRFVSELPRGAWQKVLRQRLRETLQME